MKALSLAVLTAFLAAASLATAAEISRTEYRTQVEPICKRNTKANERILKNVRRLVRKGKLRKAAVRFAKASRALKRTWRQLRSVPQPTGDEARLARWLKYVKIEANLFMRVAMKLRARKRGPAQRLVNKLTTNANRANALVLAFNFRFCRFEPAKFT